MRALQKGTTTAVLATIATSAMILLTGNGIADSKNKEKVTSADASSKDLPVKVDPLVATEKGSVKLKKSSLDMRVSMPLAPPGPFFSESSRAKSVLAVPVAPKEPINNLQKPEPLANSLHFKMLPSLPPKTVETELAMPQLPFAPVQPSIMPTMKQNAPELVQKIGTAPLTMKVPVLKKVVPKSNTVSTAAMPVTPKNISKKPVINPKSAPIWMRKDKIDSQGLDTSLKGMSPENNVNVQTQMPNTGWNYPVQQYMYIPVPMMPTATLSPPQMPLAPVPNYWVPTPSYQNTPMKKDHKQAIEQNVTPAQKGNK